MAEGAQRGIESVVLIGCGAIGLPLGVGLASRGHRVLGLDIDAARVATLSRGDGRTGEADLQAALEAALAKGALAFATRLEPANERRAFVIAVPTPAGADGFDGGPLAAAAASIDAVAREGDLVCVRSTVPIGATRRLAQASARRLAWAACPDRSVSGRAFAEQFEVPNLVGGLDADAGDQAEALLSSLSPVVRVRDPETAEAIKLFGNVSRDVTFALVNQFALVCEAAGVDIEEVRTAGGSGYDRFRLGRPGPVGGPCLTKDVHVLAASEALHGLDLGLLMAGRAVNQSIAPRLAAAILDQFGEPLRPVAILGMAFKGVPATLDQRGGFGGELARELARRRGDLAVRTWDPVETPDQAAFAAAVRGAGAVVLANEHPALAAAAQALPGLAPGAWVYDVAGALPADAALAGVQLRRFGAGGTRR